jgi:hypothetical protein
MNQVCIRSTASRYSKTAATIIKGRIDVAATDL